MSCTWASTSKSLQRFSSSSKSTPSCRIMFTSLVSPISLLVSFYTPFTQCATDCAQEWQKMKVFWLFQFILHLFVRVTCTIFPVTLKQRIQKEQHLLQLTDARLKLLDPELPLKRGYSITLHQGKPIKNIHLLQAGEQIETRVEQGTITSVVTGTQNKHPKWTHTDRETRSGSTDKIQEDNISK